MQMRILDGMKCSELDWTRLDCGAVRICAARSRWSLMLLLLLLLMDFYYDFGAGRKRLIDFHWWKLSKARLSHLALALALAIKRTSRRAKNANRFSVQIPRYFAQILLCSYKLCESVSICMPGREYVCVCVCFTSHQQKYINYIGSLTTTTTSSLAFWFEIVVWSVGIVWAYHIPMYTYVYVDIDRHV